MAAAQEKTTTISGNEATSTAKSDPRTDEIDTDKIDPTAPAGSKNSLGAESVRDGRPDTGDDVVEAIDEEGPGFTAP